MPLNLIFMFTVPLFSGMPSILHTINTPEKSMGVCTPATQHLKDAESDELRNRNETVTRPFPATRMYTKCKANFIEFVETP
jgi:hypothetical protein